MERAPNDLKELAKLSDQYLKAHGKQLYREFKNAPDDSKTEKLVCTNCKKTGHKIQDCRWLKNEKTKDKPRCFSCGKEGHFQRDCRVKKIKSAVSVEKEPDGKNPEEYSACCLIHSDAQRNLTKFDKIKECIRGDQLMLKNGESVDIITNACQEKTRSKTMPVMQGRIGHQTVTTLRDTGCSGAVVKQKFVNESQYTGRFAYMVLAYNTLGKAPIVKLNVQTPFYCGEIQAIAPPDAVYDLIIGNVEGAREPNDPDLNWDRTENNMEVKHTEFIVSANKDKKPLQSQRTT